MLVWRIARAKRRALDGEGARLFGGRWNTPGKRVVYASESLSLAALELLVHLEPSEVPDDLVSIEIEIPDGAGMGAVVDPKKFTDPDWRATPAPAWQAELGDTWVEDGTFLWLAVPSAVVPQERNILINPGHPEFRKVRVKREREFAFDLRLME